MKYPDKYTDVTHVAAAISQYPELLGILGKKLIASLEDAKVERIDAALLTQYPWAGDRYLIISTDGRLLVEVGTGFRQWLRKLFNVTGERVIEALRRLGNDIGYANYIVSILKKEEEEGFVLAPKRMVIHLLPTGQNMPSLVKALAGKVQTIIAAGDND